MANAQPIAHRPPLASSQTRRAIRGNVVGSGRYLDGVGNLLGAGGGFGLRDDLSLHENVAAWFALDLDAAIRLGIDRHCPGGDDGELPDVADAFAVIVVVAFVATPVVRRGLLRRSGQGRGG